MCALKLLIIITLPAQNTIVVLNCIVGRMHTIYMYNSNHDSRTKYTTHAKITMHTIHCTLCTALYIMHCTPTLVQATHYVHFINFAMHTLYTKAKKACQQMTLSSMLSMHTFSKCLCIMHIIFYAKYMQTNGKIPLEVQDLEAVKRSLLAKGCTEFPGKKSSRKLPLKPRVALIFS